MRAIMGYWEVLGMISRVMVVTKKITGNVRWLVHFLIPARKDSKAQMLKLVGRCQNIVVPEFWKR